MPFFDFHCHPGLKPTFADQSTAPSVWTFIDAKLAVFENVELSINPLFNEVLNSQCCLTQIFEGDVKLFGIALHAPESAMGEGLLQKKLVNKGAIPLLNHDRLELIKSGKHYFEFLNEDLERLTKTDAPSTLNGAKLKVIKNASDFNEADRKTVFGFLIVEGLHCFFNDQFAVDAYEVFKRNFESFTNANTILAINVCHIEQNIFCNHAYGIQFINNPRFLPRKNGITDHGREMIARMLEKNILADIKHMSLLSRIQLYNILQDPDNSSKYIAPIICTHAGLTGQKINDRLKYILKKPLHEEDVYEVAYLKPKSRYIDNVYFNCSSINLYDEEIEIILLSDGLIGLSLDQRILGFADENVLRSVTIPNDVEFISNQEAGFFFGPDADHLPIWTDDSEIWTTEDFENLEPVLNRSLHPLFFINQIVHVLVVAQQHPMIGVEKATKKICLGSDFDGLINSIDNCKQVEGFQEFKELIIKTIPQFFKKAGLENERIDVEMLVNNIFYNNGRDFVITRLQTIGKN